MVNNLSPLAGPVDASGEPEFMCDNDMGQVCREFWPGSPGSWCNGCVNRELHEAAQWRAHGAHGVTATVKASPEDWPAARLVTPQELRTFLSETLAAAVPSSPAQERLLTRAREALASTRYEFDSDCKIAMQIVKEIDTATSLAQLKAFRPTTDQPTDADIEPALPPSSPVADSQDCPECGYFIGHKDFCTAAHQTYTTAWELLKHIQRGHTAVNRENYIECSCGATFWRPPRPPSAPSPSAGAAQKTRTETKS